MGLAKHGGDEAIAEYRKVGVSTDIENASPHKLIQMLLEGAIGKIHQAQGFLEHQEIARKCEHIDWSMAIIEGLKSSLDMEQGGEIAQNLFDLYDYMIRRLALANATNDPTLLEEVTGLLIEIRTGWVGIAGQLEDATTSAAEAPL